MKNIKFLLVVLILCAGYMVFLIYTKENDTTSDPPVIKMTSDNLEISVSDGESALLKGISVTDDKDGNITKSLFVESISAYDANMQRTVTYAVFDSDDNLATATRTISYSDYTAPEINIISPLYSYYYVDSNTLLSYVDANSCVDGDITSLITIDQDETNEQGIRTITFSVTDSCGTKSSLTTKFTQLASVPSYNIELSNYLLNVPVGTYIDPYAYITSITNNGMDVSYLSYLVSVDTDYNAYEPGTYEYVYRIDRSGETGYTKLVVRVI